MRPFTLLAALLLTTLTATAAPPRPPNIVWIVCEDLDETLGCYGHPGAHTPNIDALADGGVLYRNAFATAPICAPARSCLITGLYPTALGSQHLRCEVTLPPSVKPFPALLRDHGYFTTNHSKTDYNFSPDGLYDFWKNNLAPWRKRTGENADQPFFSFFNFGTTHEGPGNFRDRYDKATRDLTPGQRHDPDKATVPPYFPDTPKFRELLARYDDLVTAMDAQVGEILANLEADGLEDETVVFFFSDHGHGLPRHKRWLYDSGLRVPLVVRVPPAYGHLAAGHAPGSQTDRLVSFVDFAPTVLALAGATTTQLTHGLPFLGRSPAPPRTHIYGARDRADDMFELSRAVHDGRYLYVRHFLPHHPYIQGGRISGNRKESYAELRRARDNGELTPAASLIWQPRKPVEELYDLQEDPHEIHNLATAPTQADRLTKLRQKLQTWILDHRDTGFLTEAEYHRRATAAGTSIFDIGQAPKAYDLNAVLDAATRATSATATQSQLRTYLAHPDPGVRYWGATGFLASALTPDTTATEALTTHLTDQSPSVAIAAATVLAKHGHPQPALDTLLGLATHEQVHVALEAARALHDIGPAAKPAAARIEEIRKSFEDPRPDRRRRYRDFNYASFTAWALEAALANIGAAKLSDFD